MLLSGSFLSNSHPPSHYFSPANTHKPADALTAIFVSFREWLCCMHMYPVQGHSIVGLAGRSAFMLLLSPTLPYSLPTLTGLHPSDQLSGEHW